RVAAHGTDEREREEQHGAGRENDACARAVLGIARQKASLVALGDERAATLASRAQSEPANGKDRRRCEHEREEPRPQDVESEDAWRAHGSLLNQRLPRIHDAAYGASAGKRKRV